jgi:hypothetical protein
VTSTATFTEDDWLAGMRMRQLFYFAERRGMLRQLATYVRAETGTEEMAFYDHLRRLAESSSRHPQLAYALRVAPVSYLPPGTWRPLIEEVGQVMVADLGVADDSALRTVLQVQLAVFLTPGRQFPSRIDLDHDFVAWHDAVIAAKQMHPPGGWTQAVGPLRSFPPGTFEVRDERGRIDRLLGQSTIAGFDNHTDWELDTLISRPVQAAP